MRNAAIKDYKARFTVTVGAVCIEPPAPVVTAPVNVVLLNKPPRHHAARPRSQPLQPCPVGDRDLLDIPRLAKRNPAAAVEALFADAARKLTPRAPVASVGVASLGVPTARASHTANATRPQGLLVPLAWKPSAKTDNSAATTSTAAANSVATAAKTPKAPSRQEQDATTWLPYAIRLTDHAPTESEAFQALAAHMDEGLLQGLREAATHGRLRSAIADAIAHNKGARLSEPVIFRLLLTATYKRQEQGPFSA